MFDAFWTAYPRKVGKGAALKAWAKLKDKRNTLTLILGALAWQTKTHDWTKEAGQFIPYPATWLNEQRWLDEPPPEQPQQTTEPFDADAYRAKRKADAAAARERMRQQEISEGLLK